MAREYCERRERGDLVTFSKVKEEKPEVMKILIGNIPPMGEVKITFVYVEELEVSINHFWKFRLPSTISLRYCNEHTPIVQIISKDNADKAMLESMPQA
jgi:hypothetical protein